MNFTFNKLILLFIFLNSGFSFSQCCTFTLEMDDSYGDGWTGGANIDIYVNGSAVLTNQAASGFGSDVTFTACTGDVLTYNYATGSYNSENSFVIVDNSGTDVYNGASNLTAGTFALVTAICVPTCTDGIQNQGETGIDCGGPCVPCHCGNGVLDGDETSIDFGGSCGNCNDGIQNGPETGIDCGGPFCLPCNTNNSTTNSASCCQATAQATVYPTNCDQVGTSAYNLNSPIVNMNSSSISAGCMPSPSPTGCGTVTGTGSWTMVDLDCPIDYIQLAPVPPYGVAPGNHTTYHSYYQGTDCANLSFIDCQMAMDFSSGSYFIFESSVSGLDCNLPVWIYTWDSGNKAFNQDYQIVGAVTNPNSTGCPGSAAIGDACNLGAQGASFNTPGSQGVACGGGSWGSNENTTFYSFTADATTGSLEIGDIICNDGTTGNAQFAVWTDCSAIGTYGAEFLGCAVGTASISLNPLVPGQTYYIAADGFAGDNCTWSFTGTGIVLPIELGAFGAIHTGREVEVDWMTVSEVNNDYFTVQRTVDGVSFEDIGVIQGAGSTQERQGYSFVDYKPFKGTSYYRLKQTDFDGAYKYSELVSVTEEGSNLKLVKTVNLMGQEVDLSYPGVVIDIYSDGTSTKRVQ